LFCRLSADAKGFTVTTDIHIETGDQNAVKNLLDDTIVEFFQGKEDFKLHYGWDNAKLLLMLLATVIAAVSHFFKHPAIPEHVLVYSCVGA
jgi:hypothetical protein